MKAIHEYLDITQSEHEDYIQRLFMNWAENHSINPTHWQNIMANAAVNRWFWAEVNRAHLDFLKFVSRYDDSSTVTTVDFNTCYRRCMSAIFEIFPKPLIEAMKPKVRAGDIVVEENGQRVAYRTIKLQQNLGVIGALNVN